MRQQARWTHAVRLLLACLSTSLATGLATEAAAAPESIRVSSSAGAGPGTLREAISRANDRPGSTIKVELDETAVVVVDEALPALQGRGTRLLGGGVTLRQGSGCRRPDGRPGCSGLVIAAAGVELRNLRIVGFTFDGVSVVGRGTSDVRIVAVEAIDNLDDGIGLSGGAGPVRIEDALLMGNGYRTKGKGLLVFDDSQAELVDSIVLANRDGVTVTRGSLLRLKRVLIAGNYDKGLGVSAAIVEGTGLDVLSNGYDSAALHPSPNGDGLRVGLGGEATLFRTRIAGSGDAGVVVLDRSSVKLRDCVVEANRGVQTAVSGSGRLRQR